MWTAIRQLADSTTPSCRVGDAPWLANPDMTAGERDDRTQVSLASDDIPAMTYTYAYFQSLLVTLRDRQKGQTMAEYAVVLTVITIAIVATLTLLAGGIKSTLNSVTSKL